MSRLVEEIRQCMSDLTEVGDDALTARFLFPPDFIGFQGHFPGMPILPAVCKIQAAVAMLQASKRRTVWLEEIVLARFSAPITCDEEVEFLCTTVMEGANSAVVKTIVSKSGEKVSRFKLRVALKCQEPG